VISKKMSSFTGLPEYLQICPEISKQGGTRLYSSQERGEYRNFQKYVKQSEKRL